MAIEHSGFLERRATPVSLAVLALDPLGWRSGAKWDARSDGWERPYSLRGGPPHLRVFAGQPDPADRSHFWIDFEEEDQQAKYATTPPATRPVMRRGRFDGWLLDDSTVKLVRQPDPPPPPAEAAS